MSAFERDTWLARDRENRLREQAQSRLFEQLTPREREVLDLLAQGQRPAAIAERFVVSLGTVRAQIKSVREKLGVSSQLEAAALVRPLADTHEKRRSGRI